MQTIRAWTGRGPAAASWLRSQLQWSGRQLALKLEPLRPGMRVLYMSGYTDDTLLRYGVQENQVPFLQKPFTADALVAKVKKAISGCS